MTDRYAVIGNPVAHSKSPWIHAEFARSTRQDIEYLRIEAPQDGFARTVGEFRSAQGRGANVTLPFKEAAFRYCDEVSPEGTPCRGCEHACFRADRHPRREHRRQRSAARPDNEPGVLRSGSGDSGARCRGCRPRVCSAHSQARARSRSSSRIEPSPKRNSSRNGSRLQQSRRAVLTLLQAGISSSSSMPHPPGWMTMRRPVPTNVFRKGALAYELVYGRDTPFLALARRCGAATADGTGMLVEQAADSFFLWRGIRPDTAPVLAALRAA